MGLTRGTSIEMIRYAPMGDPIEISVRGYRLSLRRVEAESVIVLQDVPQ
jgi:ferrous iron transport protein A